jgi:hypothetical protein
MVVRDAVAPGLLVAFAGIVAGPEQWLAAGQPVAEPIATVATATAADQALLVCGTTTILLRRIYSVKWGTGMEIEVDDPGLVPGLARWPGSPFLPGWRESLVAYRPGWVGAFIDLSQSLWRSGRP